MVKRWERFHTETSEDRYLRQLKEMEENNRALQQQLGATRETLADRERKLEEARQMIDDGCKKEQVSY